MQLTFPFASENRFVQLRPWWGRTHAPLFLTIFAVASFVTAMVACCHR